MIAKKHLLLFLLVSVAAIVVASDGFANPPSAADILAASDGARFPQKPFRVSLGLFEYVNGEPRGKVYLTVRSKIGADMRQFKNLVSYVAPPRDVGKLVLLNGPNMWFYDPASKASIRISPQQRLTGQAANGDVLAVNLAHDYEPKIVGEEKVRDADHGERNVWHLDLKASTSSAMYAHIEYWIEKETYRSIKAKFYSDSNRLLKIAYYRKFEAHLGAARATETVIIDAVNSNLVTKISYSDFRFEDIQDACFQREYLPQFRE